MNSNSICIESILGPISLFSRMVDGQERLCGLAFAASADSGKQTPLLGQAAQQLSEYFNGQRQVFDLPLVYDGSQFQQAVWQALQSVPFGRTRSYGEIAAAIGNPLAARAVGNACGSNPIAIIIPCHRIIAAGGKIGGFSSGLDTKRRLLALEAIKTI